uniref:Regulator of G protein signaling 2 n=1 Tax=Oncorhynchus kisutch TaxID=8019 RepID=A0A8C7IRR6_ONCKI
PLNTNNNDKKWIFAVRRPQKTLTRPKGFCINPGNRDSTTSSIVPHLIQGKNCTGGQVAFRVFLKSEFCEENLEFWLACEEFKSITSPEKLAWKATSIYEEFIQSDSPMEVNVDYHTRDTIAHSLHKPTPSCFDGAQRKVCSLMENDAYPRFIQSDYYKDLCAGSRGLGKHKRT